MSRYEVRVAGLLGPVAREALMPLASQILTAPTSPPTSSVVVDGPEPDGLHAVLERVQAFRLELLEIRHLPDRD